MKGLLKGVLRSERGFVVALAVLSTPGMAPELDAQDARPSLYQPTASPDGSEIAFVSSGEIWTAPSTGGVARILVAHEADESAPLYSPDGTRLAFVSNRAGDNDVYVIVIPDRKSVLAREGHVDVWEFPEAALFDKGLLGTADAPPL
ncbi:MAG: hypothetical protein P8L45_02345, partial [Longimicrobiales bacterium]|nr:hypothetical protein [Longimicrobiales bacterium]